METFAKWIQLNLNFVQTNFVTKVTPDYAQLAVSAFVDRLLITAEIMFDENQDNKEQLVELWSGFTGDEKMLRAFRLGIDDLTTLITDPTVLTGVSLLKEKLIRTLVILTDNNKMNGEQVAEEWKNFFKSPEFIAFFIANAALVLDKLPLPAWLKNIINLFIKK